MLDGAPNFRDFGGQPTSDGGRVRQGVLYRSGDLMNLTDDDLARLRRLAIRTVCDLRGLREQEKNRSRWPEDLRTEFVALPVMADAKAGNVDLLEFLRANLTPEGVRATIGYTYRDLPRSAAEAVARVLGLLADADETTPLLVHCSAGKDRTGFVAAMVLAALGVEREAIFADYMASEAFLNRPHLEAKTRAAVEPALGQPVSDELIALMSGIERRFLADSFDEIVRRFGSVDAYLAEQGLTEARRARLRAALVV